MVNYMEEFVHLWGLSMVRLTVVFLALCTLRPATAADSVAEFGRNYPAFPRGQFTATTKMSFKPPAPPNTVQVTRVHMDPPRWKVLARESTTSFQNGKSVTYSMQGEQVDHLTGSLSVSADYATGRALGGVAAYVKPLPTELTKASGYGPFSFAIDSRTFFNDQNTLAELLVTSETQSEVGKLDGKPVTVVSATSRWGKLTLWLDPARSYLPLKVVQEKQAADLIGVDKPLKSVVQNEDGKPTPLDSFSQQYETTRIESVGGRSMITAFTHRTSERYLSGQVTEFIEYIVLSDIKPVAGWAKDPFVVSTIIPDGTVVTAADDKPVEYVWRGGQIVKAVNAAAVTNAGSHVFVPPAGGQWWPWAAGRAGVVAVSGLAIWRLRRTGRPA